jgi:hypothetical protein
MGEGWLIEVSEPGADRRLVQVHGPVVVGRGPSGDGRLGLDDDGVAERHLELLPVGDGLRVRLLGTTSAPPSPSTLNSNSTPLEPMLATIGGSVLLDATLAVGATVLLGQTQLRLCGRVAAPATAPAATPSRTSSSPPIGAQ